MKWCAKTGVESGIQLVPEPSRPWGSWRPASDCAITAAGASTPVTNIAIQILKPHFLTAVAALEPPQRTPTGFARAAHLRRNAPAARPYTRREIAHDILLVSRRTRRSHRRLCDRTEEGRRRRDRKQAARRQPLARPLARSVGRPAALREVQGQG